MTQSLLPGPVPGHCPFQSVDSDFYCEHFKEQGQPRICVFSTWEVQRNEIEPVGCELYIPVHEALCAEVGRKGGLHRPRACLCNLITRLHTGGLGLFVQGHKMARLSGMKHVLICNMKLKICHGRKFYVASCITFQRRKRSSKLLPWRTIVQT